MHTGGFCSRVWTEGFWSIPKRQTYLCLIDFGFVLQICQLAFDSTYYHDDLIPLHRMVNPENSTLPLQSPVVSELTLMLEND